MEPTAIFLYGTLCHAPLRRAVLGGEDGPTRPAVLRDHRVVWAEGEVFPLILPAPGLVAEGLVLEAPTPEAIRRLEYYQQSFGSALAPVEVETDQGPLAARMFVHGPDGVEPGADWSLQDWAERWGPLACLTAEEIIADMDARAPDEVARRFGPLRARAQARLNARTAAPTTLRRHAQPGDIRLRRRSLAYSQFFSVEEYDFAHRKFSGDYAEEVNRTAFISADAVTVLPYDPVRDRVLLIEQFRAGPYARGDSQPWLLEPIAGRIDGGETPEDTARREAVEEAGLTLGDLHLVGKYYPTPGAKTEFLFAYVATPELPDTAAGHLGGLEIEGEDIRSHVIAFDEAMALIDSGEINVGPLILLLLQLARMREALRAAS